MSKIVKYVLFFFGLLIVAVVLFPVVALRLEQRGQPELQARILNANFIKIQPRNGQVLLTPRNNSYLVRGMGNDFYYFKSPVLFSVGSQFRASDRHWGATYTIEEVKPEGVKINFKASGGYPSSVRTSSGTVELAWK